MLVVFQLMPKPMQDGEMEVEGMDNVEDLENVDGMSKQGKN